MTLPITLVHGPSWDEPFEGVTAELSMMAVIELGGQSLKAARQLGSVHPTKVDPAAYGFSLGPQSLCLAWSGDDLPQTIT